MARPCLIKLKARAVCVAPGADVVVDTLLDRVPVIGVEISVEGEQIDRSDVYTPNGMGLGAITTARKTQFVLTQEVYRSVTPHEDLLRACGLTVTITGTPENATAVPSESTCEGDGFVPCTIEIIEVGGNLYRATDCTGIFSLAGEPGQRHIFTFTMTGHFSPVVDNAYPPLGIPASPGLPVLYKNSVAQFSTTSPLDPIAELASCPAYEFSPNVELVDVPSACTPDGGGWDYPVAAGPSSIVFSGVVSRKESLDQLWDLALNPPDDMDFAAALYLQAGGSPGNGGSLIVQLAGASLLDPAPTDVQGFAGYDVTIQGSSWTIRWIEDN